MKGSVIQWLRVYRRLLIGFAFAIAVYAAVGFFWVPHLARTIVGDYVHEEMRRKLSIGELKFNPFTLTARVNKLALSESDDAPIASFDSLLVNFELSSLLRRGFVFKEIRIDNPSVSLRVYADASFNLAKLAPSDGSEKSELSELPRIRIGTFALHRGRVAIADLSRPTPFTATLAPIEFSLADFRTEPKFDNAYRFSAATPGKEILEWSGEFSVAPLGSTGRFTLSSIKATTIAAYLQDSLPFDLQSGILDLQGEYALALLDRLEFRLKLPTIDVREAAIAIRGTETAAPWIKVPKLSVTGTALSLGERKLSVDDVHVSDMVIDAWREVDGSINLMRLFSNGAAAATVSSAQTPTNESPWSIAVKNVQIEHAHINAEDRSTKPNAKFALALDIKATGYSGEPKSTMTLEGSVGVDERGLIGVSGPVTLSPLDLQLNIAVKDFALTSLQPYAAQSTDLTIHRGQLALKALLKYAAEPARGQPHMKLTGDAEITDLLTKDNMLEEDFIKWESLKVSSLDFQQSPDRLSIARIAARKPYGRVIIASNGTFNVAQVLNPKGSSSKQSVNSSGDALTGEPPKTPAIPARIRTISIEEGSANFADYSVSPSFATEMTDLKGTIDGLSSDPDSRAKVQLTGSVDRYAPVSITGEVNLLSTDTFTDIAMNFRNMELTTFNPYSGKFAGYNISKGKLSTEMQYKVEKRDLDARHHIVIDQLEFGDATNSKDAVSLPIKLAVALLKDRHGVIDLDLPVSGNMDDPRFRLGPIVWQVLKNTLEKIVTAPFALLGRLFGGGEELAYVDFAQGSSALTADANGKLSKLKQAMIERPQLKLDVPMRVSGEADATALSRATLEQALAALPKAAPDRVAALAATYTKEFGKPPAYPEIADKSADVAPIRARFLEETLLEKFRATPARLEELGRARGTAVRDLLVAGGEIAPERVFLSARALEEKSKPDAVRMELKLE